MTYAAPRATKTDAAHAFDPLVEPMQMRMDDPTVVAAPDLAGRRCKTSTASMPKARSGSSFSSSGSCRGSWTARIAAQMADPRVRDYLGKRYEAARTRPAVAPKANGTPGAQDTAGAPAPRPQSRSRRRSAPIADRRETGAGRQRNGG